MSVQAHLDFTFSVNIPSIKRETLARDHVQVFCSIHEDFFKVQNMQCRFYITKCAI